MHPLPRVLALAALAVTVVGCSGGETRRASRVSVLVARAERRDVPYEIDATGTVEAFQTAEVRAQVGGLVTRIAFREGDDVRAGQPLFHIDPRPFDAAVERAAAMLARSRAQAQTAAIELERAETLARDQVISQAELERKRAEAQSLAATARGDEAALRTARLDRGNATVRAPISGRTGSLSAHVGDLVRENDGGAPLVTINQVRPVRVRFTVPQTDLAALRRQDARRLRVDVARAGSDTTWIQGTLAFVDNAVDPTTGTVLLKGEFANRDAALWPGEFVRVRLTLYDQAGATVVPSVAVTQSQTGPYLYVIQPDTTVEARPVKVDRNWRDYTIIASGLEPGETVVTDGQLRLSPGARAQIREPGGRRDSSTAAREARAP